ncbi:uncharacterized protein LOC107872242 isoform X2 [Capsicum annuum]|uniref:uncharacterized protein LOC107872242 isoform X2 n=1 Tax=Capsicum annuum TaxID=4072 RepID=UPI001FB17B06|nr:uncharacterized protein LOC107872242 isoform X2 [Capsicum annuum]
MEHDYENCCCKLNMPDSDDENVIDKECWNKYLQQLNESEGTKYEVNEILKVNRDECGTYLIFYLTFTVTNGEKEYFQAKVVRRMGGSLCFLIVRPRSFGHIVDVKALHRFGSGI